MRDMRRRRIRRKEKRAGRSKKKLAAILCGCAVVIVGVSAAVVHFYTGSTDDVVPVSTVSEIMGLGSASGSQNRYAGVIESQKSWTAKKDADRDIKKVYVKEGDTVEIGDKLFKYDASSMDEQLAEAKIEVQQYEIDIADLKSQVKELEQEKASAASADKLSYTLQIQSAQNDIKKNEYEKKQKEKEISSMKKSKKNNTVVSELAGVVTKVNSYTNSDGTSDADDETVDDTGSDEELITITGVGNYRVKCKINEQNYSEIAEGDSMLVHSRVDETLVWSGTVSGLNTDDGTDSTDGDTDDEEVIDDDTDSTGDSLTTSSSYTFYVDLDSSDDLLLGQHVYVEPDNGQEATQDGVWLDEAYICDADGDAYVWADNGHGRLEKKTVVLGTYNEELFQYEITAGLTLEDKIAYPDESCVKGAKTQEQTYDEGETDGGDGEEELDEDIGDDGEAYDVDLESTTIEETTTVEEDVTDDFETDLDSDVSSDDGEDE